MKSSIWKPVFLSFIILTGAFAGMELFSGNIQSAAGWLFACMIILIIYKAFYLKQAKGLQKEKTIESLHDSALLEKMNAGELIPFPLEEQQLQPGEICYWYDTARQDYYDGKEGVLYLTDERLIFPGKDFTFSIPLALLEIQPTKNGFAADVNGKRMPFITGNTESFLKVFEKLKNHQLPDR